MKNSIKIQGTKKTASFFEKMLAEKKDMKAKIQRKFEIGELSLEK